MLIKVAAFDAPIHVNEYQACRLCMHNISLHNKKTFARITAACTFCKNMRQAIKGLVLHKIRKVTYARESLPSYRLHANSNIFPRESARHIQDAGNNQ